ncbi:UbiA prenyltransferase family protein [Anaerotruncus colihominis]|uniref:UbiA prenyltransferase family protein n=1 Tax=Anaerotruncus colihominis TaxID=169435 RepID=UPI0018999DF7|nr:UbiA prenyltransferase family protein [Anaerotruncus colihominis]
MTQYLKLLRVKHYLKNGLIFFPLIFSRNLFDIEMLLKTFLGFIAFSFAASIIYVINDMRDIENDRQHPTKCNRPLASGAISISSAKVIIVMLIIFTIIINWLIAGFNLLIWAILIIYVGSNLIYSLGAKNMVLIDVFILTLGYILRLYYGALIIGVEVSSWMYLTILAMAFFLGLGKRRNELRKNGIQSRQVLQKYSWEFLDKNMYMCLGAAILFYSLWCESMVEVLQTRFLLWTVPLVILICMRYSLIVENDSDGDPIEVVFTDKMLLALILVFVIAVASFLYLPLENL